MSAQLENQILMALDRATTLATRFVAAFEALVSAHEKTVVAVAKLVAEDRVHRATPSAAQPASDVLRTRYGINCIETPLTPAITGYAVRMLIAYGVDGDNNDEPRNPLHGYVIEAVGQSGDGTYIVNRGRLWRLEPGIAHMLTGASG